MNLFEKYKKAFVCILLPAMLMLAGNSVFNWHVHKNDQGQLIVHAHPFHNSGNTQGASGHSHSAQDCFSINQLTSFLFVLAAVIIIALQLGKSVDISKVYHYHVKKNLLATLLPNRAPPVLA
ncbi:hypothetical protein [Marinifilum sp. D737]|uniref:hypothetical protein n=1 Tax=Marinifilum sp. D737 TaxID=2969628 RepID=UPI002273E09A|nr:hypothetical protein [Marinifilum sp. D737]MCY1634469.1 hypothetical protein [Marinifilum sp. D737]